MDDPRPNRLSFRVKFRSWVPLLTGHDCVTLGSTIYTRKTSLRAHTVAHEYCHVTQFAHYGVLGFLWRYLREQVAHGYVGNALEREAHEYADKYANEFVDVRADK